MVVPASHIATNCRIRPSGHHPTAPQWHLGPAAPFSLGLRLKGQGLCLLGSSPSSHPHCPASTQVQHSPGPRLCNPSSEWAQLSHLWNGEAVETGSLEPSPPSQPPAQTACTHPPPRLCAWGTPPECRYQILLSSPCPEPHLLSPPHPTGSISDHPTLLRPLTHRVGMTRGPSSQGGSLQQGVKETHGTLSVTPRGPEGLTFRVSFTPVIRSQHLPLPPCHHPIQTLGRSEWGLSSLILKRGT